MRPDVERTGLRFLVLAVLLGVPFFRMLLQHEYGLLYPEVGAALVLILAVSAAGAVVLRRPWMFHTAVAGLIVLLCTNAVQLDLFPNARQRWLLAGVAAGVAAAFLVLKQHVYRILLVFIVGNVCVDAGKALLSRPRSVTANTSNNKDARHVVHIVFDEMIGLAGMPPGIGECTAGETRGGGAPGGLVRHLPERIQQLHTNEGLHPEHSQRASAEAAGRVSVRERPAAGPASEQVLRSLPE